MKMKKHVLFIFVLLAGISPLQADDTDIYLGAAAGAGGIPLIMLTLDYRPNLGASVCNDVAALSCKDELGEELYQNLSLDGDSDPDYDDVPLTWAGKGVTLFDVMRTVFKVVLEAQANKDLRVGMMISHDNSCNGSGPYTVGDKCSNGAYVLKGYFDPTDTIVDDDRERDNCAGSGCSNLDDLLFKLSRMTVPQGNLSHKFQGKEVYLELFRYLTGDGIQNGHLGFNDFGSPNSARNYNLNDAQNEDGNGNATTDFAWDSDNSVEANNTTYKSPFDNNSDWSCASNYAINTMFQVSQQEDDSDDAIAEPLQTGAGGGGLGLTGNTSFPDVIQHLKNIDMADRVTASRLSYNLGPDDIEGDQNLTSYFIAAQVNNTTNGYARAGGTKTAYALDDPAQLLTDFKSIFSEILSQSSIFVAASVPVSTFNRLEVASNVFFALFQAKEEPYWPGNVKKLKIDQSEGDDGSTILKIIDKNGVSAFGADGRIKAEVVTHWTDTSDVNLEYSDTDADEADDEANEGTDGRRVTRGASGQQIPGYLSDAPGDSNTGDRQMYLEPNSGTTLVAFNATDTLAESLKADLGVVDADYGGDTAVATAAAKNMIRWLRGQDVLDEDSDGETDDARSWMMADPMHSRPLALNYGATPGYSETNPQIRLIFGSNDGVLHFVENTTPGGAESGEEILAFVAKESLANVQTLMGGPTTPPHPYGIDGEPVALILDKDNDGTIEPGDGDLAVVYVGMRRGGTSYYAFDVSNPSVAPEMLWKIDSASPEYNELGMSFATPALAIVQYKETPRAVLIFGGGYHGGWDATGTSRIGKDLNSDDDNTGAGEVGTAVFIVNAYDGELVWKAKFGASTGAISETEYHHSELVDSIPSTVAAFDSDNDNIDDRIYVGDTGGAVWRLDIPAGTDANHRTDNWFASKIAELGTDGAVTDRRFFHAPKPFRAKDDTGTFDGVAISSGNRADPTDTDVSNYFFMIKDRNIASGSPVMRQDGGSPFTPFVIGNLTDITDCLENCSVGSNGWKLNLEASGEKGLSTPVVIGGEAFFTTFLPGGDSADGSCAPSAGSGRLYIISAADGTPTRNYWGTAEELAKQDRYTLGSTTGIPSGVVDIPGPGYVLTPSGEFIKTASEPRYKVYWREEGIDQIDN